MFPREHGSDTSRVQIHGGEHDGATGTIAHTWDGEDARIVQVALDTGGTLDLTFTHRSRETANAVTLRTLGT